ncbi:Subfamily S1A unassigned peptidase (S01 family), partial [Paragonimus heterotremus]
GNRSNAGKILHFHVEKIILHPANKIGVLKYDIALMKTKGRIPYIWNRSVPALLPLSKHITQWPSAGTICTIVGWGCTRAGGRTNDVASVAKLKALNHQTCGRLLNGVGNGHQFCAGYYNSGIGTCSGDSGSGLVCKNHGSTTLMGVLSGIAAQQPQNYPGVYMRVAAFIDWIRTQGDSGSALVCNYYGSMTVMSLSSLIPHILLSNVPTIFVRMVMILDWIQTGMRRN